MKEEEVLEVLEKAGVLLNDEKIVEAYDIYNNLLEELKEKKLFIGVRVTLTLLLEYMRIGAIKYLFYEERN